MNYIVKVILLVLMTGCVFPVKRTYFQPIETEGSKAHNGNHNGYFKTAKDELQAKVEGVKISIKPWLYKGKNIYLTIVFVYKTQLQDIEAKNLLLISNNIKYKPVSLEIEDRKHRTFENRNNVGDERIRFVHLEYAVISDTLNKFEIKILDSMFNKLDFKFKKVTVSDMRFYTIND